MTRDWHDELMEMAGNHGRDSRENITRVPFGYPGSKARSLDKILPHLPHLRAYVEPFGGSGAVLIARPISKFEVFNDINSGVVCFYRVIRDRKLKDQLVDRLSQTVHSREEFIWCRDTWESPDLSEVEIASRWYYMLHYSFGKQGRNWARAKSKKNLFGAALHSNLALFHEVHNRLYNCQIENLDWRVCLQDFDATDCVFYNDPPYVDFSMNMYQGKMTPKDHDEMCSRIFKMKSFVALSGYYDEPTRSIYDKYPWDDVVTWELKDQAQGFAFETESSGYADRSHELYRKTKIEALWIKECCL